MAAAATLMPELTPDCVTAAVAGALSLAPLPFSLDLSCPVAIPSRANTNSLPWPFPVAGPSSTPDKTLEVYVVRRYYEAIYLGEILAPLAGLVADWKRAATLGEEFTTVAERLIVPLQVAEERHRRSLGPVVAALVADGKTEAAKAKLNDAVKAAKLGPTERGALETGVRLRSQSRAMLDGVRGVPPLVLSQEFEMREILVQIILLLMYRAAPHAVASPTIEPPKKRRRSEPTPSPLSPTEDTETALNALTDRLSIWLAMSEMSDFDIPGKGKAKANEGSASVVLASFWTVLTTFLPREIKFLSSFHQQVFGKEIPPELVPQKKRRKPEMTHRLVDTRLRRTSSASVSTSASAPVREASLAMGRSSSRASAASPPRERRSTSILDLEPEIRRPRQLKARPPMVLKRAQSMAARAQSKDLSKDREERNGASGGLMGRNMPHAQAQSQVQSQAKLQPLSRSQSQDPRSQRTLSKSQSETFVSATPVKNRTNPFAIRKPVQHPTPIREEPSSAERSVRSFVADTPSVRSFAAETPVASRTYHPFIAETPLAPSFVAETPVARRHGPAYVAETPFAPRVATIAETPMGGESDDDLAALMVPTDDEDEGSDGGVPETPRR